MSRHPEDPPLKPPDTFSLPTRHFGTLSIPPDQVITLSPGLPGFADCHHYFLVEGHFPPPFLGLQCLDRPDLAFVVMDPRHLLADYQLAPLPGILQKLGAASPEDLLVLVLLTLPPGRPREMTANLMAPLVINRQTRQGQQFILDNPNYTLKYPVFSP